MKLFTKIVQKWFGKTVDNPSSSSDPILEELKQEYQRVVQEMILYNEGRGAENIPINESCRITFDLLKKSQEDRLHHLK